MALASRTSVTLYPARNAGGRTLTSEDLWAVPRVGAPSAAPDGTWGYRWIYRTVVADRDPLCALFTANGIYPMTPAPELIAIEAARRRAELGDEDEAPSSRAGPRRSVRAAPGSRSRQSRRRSPGRGGTSRG